MDLVAISGSTRRGSVNTRLAQLVRELRPDDAVTVVTDLAALPFYDADVEAEGTPPAVAALRAAIADADAVVVATPEYNGSVPGVLGNAVDWLSRPKGASVLQGKPVLVVSASPGRFGGRRAAQHLRDVLAHIGAVVLPGGPAVGDARRRLGERVDPDLAAELTAVLGAALDDAALPDATSGLVLASA